MKFRALAAVVAMVFLLWGCMGAKNPVSNSEVRNIIDSLPNKTFEVSKVELTVAPEPTAASKKLFNDLTQPVMIAPISVTFRDGLSALLARDLGIKANYSQLQSNLGFETTRKAGFVWESDLFSWIAYKEFDTGDQVIEITTNVPNPQMAGFETIITVKNDSTTLKEYKISAIVVSEVNDTIFARRSRNISPTSPR